jgi:hypothetical protein
MSGTVLAAATRGDPAPDDAVHIDFHVSNVVHQIGPGRRRDVLRPEAQTGPDFAVMADDVEREDATLRGATPQDAPVKIDAMDAQLSGRDGGIAIDEVPVRCTALPAP